MPAPVYDVLFLCTGNSARSILAECLLRERGGGRFRVHSAGSHPTGRVHPMALEVLEQHGHPTRGLRSKSRAEFEGPDAPPLDFVFTVCDDAAGESCPVWPGRPMTAHWGLEDPAAVEGSDAERRWAFRRAYAVLEQRVGLLSNLRVEALDRMSLKARVDEIGKAAPSMLEPS